MTRLNLMLLLALLASCVYLVSVAHESRKLYADLDKARTEERLLDSELSPLPKTLAKTTPRTRPTALSPL